MTQDLDSGRPSTVSKATVSEEAGEEGAATGPPLRRSARARKPTVSCDESYQVKASEKMTAEKAPVGSPDSHPAAGGTFPVASSPAALAAGEPRRNPKRKVAPETFDIQDDLLGKALAPMGAEERRDWQSWIEVESDPAFFNVILRELGVHDVQVQELFTLDSLGDLPKPVHGLVFLYQYMNEIMEDEAEDSSHVWFANQTTSNACATVALLNIIMNARNVELGKSLKAFKTETAELDPPLRGNMLTNNAAIRTAHNSFARRLDFLNADLMMDNEVQDLKKAKAAKSTTKARSRTKMKGGPSDTSSGVAFHFIAYVPIGTKIWQLDGLQSRPLCLGNIEGDWTSSIGPHIESRMLQYETEQVSFNLLALCRNPLGSIRRQLAEKIRCLDILQKITTDENKQVASWLDANGSTTREGKLAAYGLAETDIGAASSEEAEELLSKAHDAAFSGTEKAKISQRLREEQEYLLSHFASQQASMDDDSGVATGRKKDYTQAIHEWTKKLVEHGILRELQQEVGQSDSLS